METLNLRVVNIFCYDLAMLLLDAGRSELGYAIFADIYPYHAQAA